MTRRARSLEARTLFADEVTSRLGQFGDTELRLLRLFVVVVKAGGFSAATAELQVDLSTVSRQFKELETRLGTPLAKRGRGGFVLTAQGHALHRLTQGLFTAIGEFSQAANSLAAMAAPQLRLGVVDALLSAPDMAGARGLPAMLRQCVQALPGMQLELHQLRPTEIERRVLADELDAGLMAARPPAAGLEQHRLYSEGNGLYVAPGHPWFERDARKPLSDADLAAMTVVTDPYWNELPPAALRGLALGRTRADSIEGVAMLVASGLHAGFLPHHLVAWHPALATAKAVEPARFGHVQDIVLTCRTGQTSSAVRVLIKSLLGRNARA